MRKKKFLSLLLSALMLVTMFSGMQITASAAVWSGKAASSFAGGNGSKSSPYIIKTGEQLARMRNLVNSSNYDYYSYRHAYYKLGADIILNSNSSNYSSWGSSAPARRWVPIGNSNVFYGNFNGNGYTISGLYVNSSDGYAGLFGYCGGSITNLKIKNSYINGKNNYTGAVVGYIYGGSDAKVYVSNCSVSSSVVKGTNYTGGVIGISSSYVSVYKCSNSAKVTGQDYVGGITGDASVRGSKYYSNTNSGAISGEWGIGGVCGYMSTSKPTSGSSSYTVYALSNKGSVTATESNAGGVIGYLSSGTPTTLSKSYNSAAVKAEYNAGGLIGSTDSYATSLLINQCTTTNSSTVNSQYKAGGLVGRVYVNNAGSTTIKNCNSGTGSVVGATCIGGLVGEISCYKIGKVIISNSISKASISATEGNSGGIVGELYNSSSTVTITKTANVSSPYASEYSGYIVGKLYNTKYDDTYAAPTTTFSNNIYTNYGKSAVGYTYDYSPTYSNNYYANEYELYNQSYCSTNLGIYPCAWKFYDSAVPVVSVSANHSYTATTKKATTSADGSITKVCKYCGKKTVTTIKKVSTVKLSATKYKYNNKVKTPAVIVKDSSGKTLVKNTDYTVTYSSGRRKVGTYNVKVTFKGNYSGTKTLSFKIVK
ncbi:MAG: hypothetical protein ACI4IG_02195 [Eubacterium sp.]